MLWNKIEGLCISEKSEIMERYRLQQIAYEDDCGKKSFESFLLRVKAQADLCNFNITERDKLIRDKIVYTLCPSWRKSIFKQSGSPTLQKVIDICRANEQAEVHSSEMNQTSATANNSDITSSDLLKSINRVYDTMRRHPGQHPSRNYSQASSTTKRSNQQPSAGKIECKFCGYLHLKGRKHCPAAADGATCRGCGLPGHFKSKCSRVRPDAPRVRRVEGHGVDSDSDVMFGDNDISSGKYS